MNKTELNSCYTACKDLFGQLGLYPADKTFKEMLSEMDIPKPNIDMVREPIGESLSWLPSFRELGDALKYKNASHTEKSDFYEAAAKIDKLYTKTSHGYLTDGPNLFARAFNTYVVEKLESEGKRYNFTDFENQNHIWYSGYCTTHPTLEERAKYAQLFEKLISDLKEKGILKELNIGKKMTMDDVHSIVERRKQSCVAAPSIRNQARAINK